MSAEPDSAGLWTPEPDAPDPEPPRRPAWGCLAAVIVAAIGMIIAVVLVARLANDALSGVHIR
jgi:hypothetical protein